METCGLLKLKWIGQQFTWCNTDTDGTRIYSRNDKVFTDETWIDMFGFQFFQYLTLDIPDHTLLIVIIGHNKHKRRGRFIYFNIWSSSITFEGVVVKSKIMHCFNNYFDYIIYIVASNLLYFIYFSS